MVLLALCYHPLGLIPHLKKVVADRSHLKQFALPIIFDLAHASASTRTELWKNDGVAFYLDQLKENYWHTSALNSLSTWSVRVMRSVMLSVLITCYYTHRRLARDMVSVSRLLIEPAKLSKLIGVVAGFHQSRSICIVIALTLSLLCP